MEDELGLNDITGEDDIDDENSDDLSDIEPVPNTATSRVEEPEFEETPIEEPENNEEGASEEMPRRSGGRRLANLRGRETASKELPAGNKLAESTKLEEAINPSNKLYQYEVGVLLDEDDDEYEAYSEVWDKKHGYYNEDWGVELDLDSAKKLVKDYVSRGVLNTYGIISEIFLSDEELDYVKDNIEENGYFETSGYDMDYSLDNVIYSVYKSDNGIVENFVNMDLTENKLQESINVDKLISKIDDLNVETQSIIGTDEGVKNYYADGYEHGIDMAKTIVREHNGSDDTDELLNDLEGKQSEIYSDIESDEDLYDCTDKDIDDICAGWVQAFDDVIELIKPELQENKKLNEDIKDETAQAAKYIALEIQERGIMNFEEIDEMAADQLGITVEKLKDEQLDTDIYISLNYEGIDNNMSTGDFYTQEYAEEHPEVLEESKLIEAPTEESDEFKKLCAEIEFQADENDFTLTKEDIKGIAKKMVADKFFFNHDIFTDENDEEAWGEINDLIISAIEAYPNKLDETKELKENDDMEELNRLQDELRGVDVSKLSDEEYEEFKIKSDRVHELVNKLYDFHKLGESKTIIDNGDEIYTIDKNAKTYTIKTPKGEKTFTFDEMNEFVNRGKGMNRIYKPMSVLAYTDFKNGNLNKWNTLVED